MDSLKDIIPRVIAPLSRKEANPSDLAQTWQRVSGGGKTSTVVAFKDGILTVHVDCSARMVKMNSLKEQYLEELSGKHPQIKNIRFKVGKVTL